HNIVNSRPMPIPSFNHPPATLNIHIFVFFSFPKPHHLDSLIFRSTVEEFSNDSSTFLVSDSRSHAHHGFQWDVQLASRVPKETQRDQSVSPVELQVFQGEGRKTVLDPHRVVFPESLKRTSAGVRLQ